MPMYLYDVQDYLRFCNYYCHFIRSFAQLVLPLTDLTHKANEFEWTTARAEDFEMLKAKLTIARILQVYYPKHEIQLWVNASDFAIRATLL